MNVKYSFIVALLKVSCHLSTVQESSFLKSKNKQEEELSNQKFTYNNSNIRYLVIKKL